MSEDVGLGIGFAGKTSVVSLSIVGQTTPACREELLAFLKWWAKHCGVKIILSTSSKKKKLKPKKKKK